jgi:glucosamine-6-phosphate deaminase
MNIVTCNDYDEMSKRAAECAAQSISATGDSLISFPGGETPLGMVRQFVTLVNTGAVDISRTRYVSLDEWVGLDASVPGTCAHFNHINLLDKLNKPFLETHIINGAAEDIKHEVTALDTFIEKHGPLDASVLGIGLNGHLGFNENGVSFDLNAHIIPLSDTTKKVMYKYFDRMHKLEFGISQGIKQIMAAKKVILIANGAHKAAILKAAVSGPVTNTIPASILQKHPNCFVFCDTEAASAL